MLDFGWIELALVVIVAIFIIGPQELPTLMRSIGRAIKRFRYMKYNLSRQFDEFMGDDPLDSVNFETRQQHPLPEDHETFDEAALDEEDEGHYIIPPPNKAADEGTNGNT